MSEIGGGTASLRRAAVDRVVQRVSTDSAVAPPEVGFCYHAATTLTRTRTHEAKVWSLVIVGFPWE